MAELPKKVMTQSSTMVRVTHKDMTAVPMVAAGKNKLPMISVRIRPKPKIDRPQRIYPAQIKTLRLPSLSESAPMSKVVTVAVMAEAATIREICSAVAWNIL